MALSSVMESLDSSPTHTSSAFNLVSGPQVVYLCLLSQASVKAKALYAYEGSNADELPFSEGDELNIIDRSDPDWWKAEQGGVVFIVPAAYLEAIDGQ